MIPRWRRALAGLLFAPVMLSAQAPGRVLDLRLQGEVSGADIDLVRLVGAFIGTDGALVVGDAGGHQMLIIDHGGDVQIVGREGEGPGEFRNIRGVGPAPGGGFWVADMVLLRAQIFSFDGKLNKTMPLTMYSTVPPATRFVTYPVAYLGGERFILHAGWVGGPAPEQQGTSTIDRMALLTVGRSPGQQRAVFWFNHEVCQTGISAPLLRTAYFCKAPTAVVSPDGSTAFLVIDTSASGSLARVKVRIANTSSSASPRSLTLILGKRRRIQSWEPDSIRARSARALEHRLPAAAEKFRTGFEKLDFPLFHPGFDKLMVSTQGTIWIGSPTDKGRTWVLMDSVGTVTGHLELPMSELPIAASGSVVWTTRPDPNGFLDLRRYHFH